MMGESAGRYIFFKRAETEREIEQIHRLNYRTFVREIPQHKDPGSGLLIDKFHDKNHYFIALCGDRVLGMISVHDRPPFSAAEKLSDPRALERSGMRPLEVRLLAIEPDARRGKILAGLLWQVVVHARAAGHTHLVISGLAEREEMYRRLGFSRLGPPVRSGSAHFIPMIAEVKKFPEKIEREIQMYGQRWGRSLAADQNGGAGGGPLSLNPGPVRTAPSVQGAFRLPPISHRSEEFLDIFRSVRRSLGALVGGAEVALFNGSGTLANDAVAAALAAEGRPGIVLTNGEFGERLIRHAARARLRFKVLRWAWGKPWNRDQIASALEEGAIGWVWGVHLESSTGVLNDLPELVKTVQGSGARLVIDCVSSLGAAPLDLSSVHLATGVAGKSLGAYAGVAMVFAAPGAPESIPSERLPPSLDFKAALEADGPLFTFPSPALRALGTALDAYARPEDAARTYRRYASLGSMVRARLRELGIHPLADERWASPVITTFHPPLGLGSEEFVRRCRDWGYDVGGLSGYLRERGLVQIATMGSIDASHCAPLFERLRSEMVEQRASEATPELQ